MSMASEYTTRVRGGFRQAGNNVAMSRALLSVGTLIRAPGRPALTRRSQSGFFSSNSSLHRSLNWFCLSNSSVAVEYYAERSGNRPVGQRVTEDFLLPRPLS